MVEFKGTKGKWDIVSLPVNGVENICIANKKECAEEDRRLIALISPIEYSDEKDEANARLISAAPEMLEALIDCVKLLRAQGFQHGTICSKAMFAIKKSTQI